VSVVGVMATHGSPAKPGRMDRLLGACPGRCRRNSADPARIVDNATGQGGRELDCVLWRVSWPNRQDTDVPRAVRIPPQRSPRHWPCPKETKLSCLPCRSSTRTAPLPTAGIEGSLSGGGWALFEHCVSSQAVCSWVAAVFGHMFGMRGIGRSFHHV
jgi:hypothetical protein